MKNILSQILYPDGIKCIICDKELNHDSEFGICDDCRLLYNSHYCARCGRAFENLAPYCDACMNHHHKYDIARAPFVFEGNVKELVYKLKYGKAQYIAKYMAKFMQLSYDEMKINPDFITFVPMPQKRERKRGYNQAFLLASQLSLLIDKPVIDTLHRTKYVKNLARMTKQERIDNIRDTIQVNDDLPLKDKIILLIDDVFTSGATVSECAKVLKKEKVKKVYVLTFATSKIHTNLY